MDYNTEYFSRNLIEAVKQEKGVYDKNHPKFLDKRAKTVAWERIAHKVGQRKEICEKRYRSLRERFARKLNEFDINYEDEFEEAKKWKYFEQMLFLKAHVTKRQSRSELKDYARQQDISNSNNDDYRKNPHTEHFSRNLIEAVKQEKGVYVKRHPKFLDKKAKTMAWERIAQKVGQSREVCENRFRRLRETFARKLNEFNIDYEDDLKEAQKWRYFDQMLFLRTHVAKRKPRSAPDDFPTQEDISNSNDSDYGLNPHYVEKPFDFTTHSFVPSDLPFKQENSPETVHNEMEEEELEEVQGEQQILEENLQAEFAQEWTNIKSSLTADDTEYISEDSPPAMKRRKTASETEVLHSLKNCPKHIEDHWDFEDRLFIQTVVSMIKHFPVEQKDQLKKTIFDMTVAWRQKLLKDKK